MKAYVIKNKEGKYFQWLFNEEPDWEDKLYNSFMHYSKENAEKSIIQWQLEDCEVVEITIAETKDLEKDFVTKNYHDVVVGNYKIALNDFGNEQMVNENLLQRLEEKDKEIEKLRDLAVGFEENFVYTLNQKIQQEKENRNLRHQVCEEIRNYIHTNEYDQFGLEYLMDGGAILNKLDQIEKGE